MQKAGIAASTAAKPKMADFEVVCSIAPQRSACGRRARLPFVWGRRDVVLRGLLAVVVVGPLLPKAPPP